MDCDSSAAGTDGAALIRLELKGHIPSKASLYRRGKNGLYLERRAALNIESLHFQLNAMWNRPALNHPEVTLEFHLRNERQDRDGALKTTLDLLQVAGVIRNDNIRHFNGWLHVAPAVISTDEKVVILLRDGDHDG